jgi:hypothetical protein
MPNAFIPTRKTNPCPLCQDTTGKCRQTDTIHLCMTFADAIAPIPGFRFLGLTTNGLWGKWIEADGQDWSEQQRQEWQRQQEQRLALETTQRATTLSAESRDRYYHQLLAQLSLDSVDRADLHRRGLTDDQIAAWGVKSVDSWQRLDWELPYTLPGVSLDGQSLNTPKSGYLCPIKDVEGCLVGFQLRLREGDTRYLWLTSATKKRPNGPTPHLPNGELPLAIHRPATLSRPTIALVEGVGAKPFILSQRQGVVVIGAAGGQFASSPQTLQHSLDVLAMELGTQTIEFYPDAGAILNRQVMRQYRRTWKRLQQWGYAVQVIWWGQETKHHPDIDELTDFSHLQQLTIAQFEAVARPRLTWLEQIKQALQRRYTPAASAIALQRQLADRDERSQAVVEYQASDRLHTWHQAIDQGYRYILDLSPPGSGKSFDAGRVDTTLAGIRHVIYISDQHRNPTVETLSASNGWVDLEARHGGLVVETTPNGGNRSKRAAKGETPSIPANCNRTRLIETFRSKHVQGADTATVICQTCPLRETCAHATGPGYGFLQQRRTALSSPKLRSHPDSLPNPQDYEFSNILLLWDEPGQSFQVKRDIQVTVKDIEQLLPILLPHPVLFQSIHDLLIALLHHLSDHHHSTKFGLNHAEVIPSLPDVSTMDIPALERILHPDLSFLNTTLEHGVDLAELPPSLRKKFSDKDAEMATQADQRLLKQWLPELLRILQGSLTGNLHLHRGTLTISLPDSRHQAIAQAAKAVIFLDATLSRQDLALKLGCPPEDIYLCRQSVPEPTNLTLTQVIDLGRLGMQRGNHQQQRAQAIVTHYQTQSPSTQVIDFKKFATAGMGAWWRDSRGRNDFEQDHILILIGTPCRNLADLLAEYAILTDCHDLDDPGFQAFVDRAIRADFHQAIGRLRAYRRPHEPLQVIILSDFDLGLSGVQQVKASSITPAAADKVEAFTLAVQQAVAQLQTEGKKVTQRAIAALTAYSQQYISRHWKLLLLLLENPNSKSSKPPESDVTTLVDILEAALPPCQTLEQVLATVGEVFFDWSKPSEWKAIWRSLSTQNQIRVLSALLLTLPNLEL